MAAKDVNYTGTVVQLSPYLHVRNRPSMAGSIIGYLYSGNKLTITKVDGDWYYATNTGGWSHSSYITVVDNGKTSKTKTKTLSAEEQKKLAKEKEEKDRAARLAAQLETLNKYLEEGGEDKTLASALLTHDLNGIYGIPYQFMENVDPTLDGTKFGRKYSEKIITKMPLLLMTPGKVEFMSNYSKSEQKGILASLLQVGTGGELETDIDDIIKNNGRYFTFSFAYADYFNYVNAICASGARYLGIEDVEIQVGDTVAKASEFKWEKALNSDLKATFTSQEFIAFYMDSSDSVSEEFSNETTQSQLASTVNGMSDLGREVGFLLGAGAGMDVNDLIDKSKLSSAMEKIDSLSSKYLKGSRLIKNIAQNFETVATGGKLLFPEIWSDSSFSRSFDITIKLRTPDKTPVAWFMNIFVPLAHLIGFAAGHTETAATASANSYFSPFLVRAFYKGLFNVDMGIVTSMSITKGKESAWTINGLPTEVDISMTIKDLYNMLSITPGTKPKTFVTNTILMDYIANTCGVNINKMDIERTLDVYLILLGNRTKNIPNNMYRQFLDEVDNISKDVYDMVTNNFFF